VDEFQTRTVLTETGYEEEWKDFVIVNCRRMFQIALLLCGSANPAENALIASVEDLDVSTPPGKDGLARWQGAIVTRSVRTADWLAAADPVALSMLQPALWPVMQIVGHSRICFVLRTLLGYRTAQCARILENKESETHALLSEAMKQLQTCISRE
jgi:hypothetical protein